MSSSGKSIILLLCTALLWSTGGILIKVVDMNPLSIAGCRCVIALPLLFYVYYKQKHFKISWTQFFGAIFYSLTVILFVVATKMTTAANAILLQYTAPIYVAILGAWFLKERVDIIDWIVIIVAFFGIFLFFIDDITFTGLWGNIIALITGLCFALLIILMRKQKDSSPFGTVFFGNILTIVICLPFIFQQYPTTPLSWLGLIFLGLFQVGLAYVLFSIAIKNVSALQGVMIPLIEPILNPIWVLLFYSEMPGQWSIIGGSIVICAVGIRSCRQVRVSSLINKVAASVKHNS